MRLLLLLAALVLGLGLTPCRVTAQVLPGTFSAGRYHSLAIHGDGTLWATGDNTYGQLGTGTTTSSPSWVQVGTASNWVMVAALNEYSLGLQADGSLWAWGNNGYGQLGTGTTTNSPTPVPVLGGPYTQLAAGYSHALALRADGSVWSWGNNYYGQLGNRPVGSAYSTPAQVSGGPYVRVMANYNQSLALQADGSLWAWGYNGSGQLGTGTTTSSPTPTLVPSGPYVQVAAGYTHTLGLRADGTLYAWGGNYAGQLGNGTTTASLLPVPVPGGPYTQVAAGSYYSQGLRADGSLWAWGNNGYGQLGTGTTTNSLTPVPVLGGPYVQVAGSVYHSLALRADGTLWAWGYNYDGQLGNGTTSAFATPNPTPAATGTALPTRSTAAGGGFGLAVRADGTLWAWGNNDYGQFGDGTTTSSLRPKQVGTNTDWVLVTAGGYSGLGLRADGTLWAWGRNEYGQLGLAANSGTTAPNPTPAQVAGTWVRVAAGYGHTLGLRADGTLWAWGCNDYGQLGNSTNVGSSAPNPTPTQVAGTYVQVAVGLSHSLGLQADGTLWTWGLNKYGQLGNSATSGSPGANPTPALVSGPARYTQVAAGYHHSLGLTADGTLYAWGYNFFGQLGSSPNAGTLTPVPTPTAAAGRYAQVATGYYSSLGLRADGTLWTWGYNAYGQLGLGTTSTTNATPTQEVTASAGWTTLAAGPASQSSLVRTASGLNFASAGANGTGQLGDGTTTDWPRFDRLAPLSSLQPLPVRLVQFEARRTAPTAVALTWATASEARNAGFGVEKAADGLIFTRLGFVAGAGSSATGHAYAYADAAAGPAAYYRLAQTDRDGTVVYSPVRYVPAGPEAPGGLQLVPNPAPGRVSTLCGAAAGAPVRVLDALGRLVFATQATADGLAPLALPAGLGPGLYLVRAGTRTARLSLE